MATKKTLLRATEILRAGGCYNSHLEDEDALRVLIADWFSAFVDLKDEDLLAAASAHLEGPDGKRWPTKFDLREVLKQRASRNPKHHEGCDACDGTGWRELVRIDPADRRARFSAPCDCPKGYQFSNPPPKKPSDPDLSPPERFDVVADAWRRKGYEVLVATADEPRFALEVVDPSEATRLRLAAARAASSPDVAGLASVLADKWRMNPKGEKPAEQQPDYDDAPHRGDHE